MPGTRLRERSSWSSVSSSTMFGFTLALPLFMFGCGALYVLIYLTGDEFAVHLHQPLTLGISLRVALPYTSKVAVTGA
jgi:hypothetical protein